ncbi:unnamed protein product, partial [Musa acuminata subsp. malaccensis]
KILYVVKVDVGKFCDPNLSTSATLAFGSGDLGRRRKVEVDVEGKPLRRRRRRERVIHGEGTTPHPDAHEPGQGHCPIHGNRAARQGGPGGRVAQLEIERREDCCGRCGLRGRGGRLDGAAAAGGAEGVGEGVGRTGAGEVGLGTEAAEPEGSGVVGACRLLRAGEGAEPNAGLLYWIADLRRVPPPRPLPHSPEPRLLKLPLCLAALRCPRSHRNFPTKDSASKQGERER